jgi:hypothetical protein
MSSRQSQQRLGMLFFFLFLHTSRFGYVQGKVSNKLGLSPTNTSCHVAPIIKGPTTFHQCPSFGSCSSAIGVTSKYLLLLSNTSGDPKSSRNKDGNQENQNVTKQSMGLHRFFGSAIPTLRVVLGYRSHVRLAIMVLQRGRSISPLSFFR